MDVYKEAIADSSLEKGRNEVEHRLVEHYRSQLQAADQSVPIKDVELLFPDQQRTMSYLFLTTHDPTGALVMNQVLDEAKSVERVLRWRHSAASRIQSYDRQGQLSLLDPDVGFTDPTPQPAPEYNTEVIADIIHDHFAGRSVPYREILCFLADSPLWPSHVQSAMSFLRRKDRVQYNHLRNSETVRFAPRRSLG